MWHFEVHMSEKCIQQFKFYHLWSSIFWYWHFWELQSSIWGLIGAYPQYQWFLEIRHYFRVQTWVFQFILDQFTVYCILLRTFGTSLHKILRLSSFWLWLKFWGQSLINLYIIRQWNPFFACFGQSLSLHCQHLWDRKQFMTFFVHFLRLNLVFSWE